MITLSHLKFEFHVIALTEHKIRHSIPIQNIEIPGYHEFIYDSSETTHGGTGLYVRKSLASKIRNDLKLVPPHPGIFESTFIEIILPGKKNLIVGCIYRHLSSSANRNDPKSFTLILFYISITIISIFRVDFLKN